MIKGTLVKSGARMELVGKSNRIFPSITGWKVLYPDPEAVLQLGNHYTLTFKQET